jgi:uncharacterized membrane protein YagU involved in acid resistance
MNALMRGAISGLAATLPMTIAMELMHRRLGFTKRYALPPRQITANLARSLGVRHQLDEDEERAATMVAHFGYGSGVGVPYALVENAIGLPPVVKGAGYGFLVWAGSYLELLPRLGLLSPATRHPAERNALMIAAHLVWGGTLGIANDRLKRRHAKAHAQTSQPPTHDAPPAINEIPPHVAPASVQS